MRDFSRRAIVALGHLSQRRKENADMTRKAAAVIGATLLALAGCNTAEGVGEDLESAGEAIDEEAEEHD
jgi:predicted small secreted protein